MRRIITVTAKPKDGRRLRKQHGKHRDPIFDLPDYSEVTSENDGSIRALRSSTMHGKATGGFRSPSGAGLYVAIRSFVGTAAREGINATETRYNIIPGLASRLKIDERLRFLSCVFSINRRRTFDIFVASIALLATSPILLFACAAMALTMHRNVFFLQPRHGQGGKLFTLIKLRSLKDVTNDQNSGHNQSRLTSVARVIRRFGIDELPQFINILKGDMSVFGPRPFDIEPNVDGWSMRYAIKPGLIGLASVREKISGLQSPLEKVVADDVEYVSRRTWKVDAWLLIMAVACILTGRIDPQEQMVSNSSVYKTLNRLALATID